MPRFRRLEGSTWSLELQRFRKRQDEWGQQGSVFHPGLCHHPPAPIIFRLLLHGSSSGFRCRNDCVKQGLGRGSHLGFTRLHITNEGRKFSSSEAKLQPTATNRKLRLNWETHIAASDPCSLGQRQAVQQMLEAVPLNDRPSGPQGPKSLYMGYLIVAMALGRYLVFGYLDA